MDPITILGLFAACLTTGALIPQVVKTWRTRSTHDLSIGMFSMIFTGTICWFIYGMLVVDIPIIFANGLACLFSSVILYFKIAEMRRERAVRAEL